MTQYNLSVYVGICVRARKEIIRGKKKGLLVSIVCFPLYKFVIHVLLHLMLLSEKLSHAVA